MAQAGAQAGQQAKSCGSQGRARQWRSPEGRRSQMSRSPQAGQSRMAAADTAPSTLSFVTVAIAVTITITIAVRYHRHIPGCARVQYPHARCKRPRLESAVPTKGRLPLRQHTKVFVAPHCTPRPPVLLTASAAKFLHPPTPALTPPVPWAHTPITLPSRSAATIYSEPDSDPTRLATHDLHRPCSL